MEKQQFDNAKFLEKEKKILEELKIDFDNCLALKISFDEWKTKEFERIKKEFEEL